MKIRCPHLISALALGLALASAPAHCQSSPWTPGANLIYYNGGSVGIGTQSPQATLHVSGNGINGSLQLQSPTPHTYITFANSVGATPYANSISVSGNELYLGGGGLGTIHLRNGGSDGWSDNMVVLPNGNVGIRTTSPATDLHLAGGTGLTLSNGNPSTTGAARLSPINAGELTNTRIAFHTQYGPSSERMRITGQGNVGIGTTNPQHLSVNGAIGAKDVIVTNTGWSDYVFRPGYRLAPLSEVEAHIQQNGHLPGIPSESEVKEKGVSVAEVQAKLLAKIEELTLHLIRQEKQLEELRRTVHARQ